MKTLTLNKKKIITSLISTGSYKDFIKVLMKLPSDQKTSYVCITNVHMTIEAYLDKSFMQIVNNADIATPDGIPIGKAIKLLYGIDQERVAGMDLIGDLFYECEKAENSIFIYGSTNTTLTKLEAKALTDYPNLQLKVFSPPFKKLSENEKQQHIDMINMINPDFVFVALGCPKQEKWMAEHKNKINSCMLGLGGAIEVYAEVKKRAPRWMQTYALEWFYRLMQDPKRLWKRYFYTNNLFIILLFKQFLLQKLKK